MAAGPVQLIVLGSVIDSLAADGAARAAFRDAGSRA
jgi:hypothetical protein